MSDAYFIGVDAREIERLEHQHAAWKPETEALWRAAGFGPGQHIADLGCGPGFSTLELAGIVGAQGSVTALDKASPYLGYLGEEARRRGVTNVRPLEADLVTLGTIEPAIDGAFCRFFLAFLIADLDRALAAVHRSLKPGGVFAAMEYLTLESTTVTPPVPGFDAHTRAWIRFYERYGGDTAVGQSLPARLERAGFTVEHRTAVGGIADIRHRWWPWWGRLMQDFGDKLVAEGLMSHDELRALTAGWKAASRNRRAFIHTPLLIQIVARKP